MPWPTASDTNKPRTTGQTGVARIAADEVEAIDFGGSSAVAGGSNARAVEHNAASVFSALQMPLSG